MLTPWIAQESMISAITASIRDSQNGSTTLDFATFRYGGIEI
jgi:hypothetical protein